MTNAFNLSQLANNTNSSGQVSLSTGVIGSLPATSLSGVVSIANGGTNNASLGVSNGVVYYGDGAKIVGLAAGSSGEVLTSNGVAAPSWVASGLASGTAAGGSGTAIPFAGIPSGVKRITLMFTALSTNGSSLVQVQLGTGSPATYATSGYSSSGAHIVTNSTGIANSSSGMLIEAQGMGPGNSRQGLFTIGNLTGNVWTMSGCTGYANVADMSLGGGSISLGGALTALRLTTTGGDSFDAGTVNILYE